MSRVEFIQGYQWAKEVAQTTGRRLTGGYAELIKLLERGLEEKPQDYKSGVQEIIEIVRRVET